MSADQLAALAGVILSLAFAYVPGLSNWYNALEGTYKRLVMAALLVAVAAGAFGLSCAAIVLSVTCDKAGALGLLSAVLAALVANQATYVLLVRRSQ